MTTIAIEPVQEVALQEETGYQLVALDRPQLESGHAKMIEWAHVQIARVEAELDGERESLAVATERKWATAAFKRRIALAERRITFYHKIEEALKAGYVIVPNFEMTIFAIRTDARKPRQRIERGKYNRFQDTAKALPQGAGEYVNPIPNVVTDSEEVPTKDGTTETKYFQYPADEFNDIEFPIALAKPALMTATAEAMARKVFDEVGVAVDTMTRWSRRGDPIVLGRIRNPRESRPDLTFFIGWYFDPTNL